MGMAGVGREGGHGARREGKKVASAASLADAAVPSVPADSDTLTLRPFGNARPDSINHADNFVTGDPREFEAGISSLFDKRIAMADAAGLDFDTHRCGTGLGNFPCCNFERPVRTGDLHDAHF